MKMKAKKKEHKTEEEDTNMKARESEAEIEKSMEAEEVEILRLQNQLESLNDKHLRLYSEFDNYKKRTAKEKMELISTASEKLVVHLLPIMDDFERALSVFDQVDEKSEAQKKGIELIYQKMLSLLEGQGVKSFNPLQEAFDAEWHEAIAQVPSPQEDLKGKIIDVVQKGYKMQDKVIRYAKVVVGI